jgi:hypothetical protein
MGGPAVRIMPNKMANAYGATEILPIIANSVSRDRRRIGTGMAGV